MAEVNIAEAKAYLARRGLSPESIKERNCGCRRCVEARQKELEEIVQRAIHGFGRRVIEIKRRAK